jgi:hypothetical protein
MLFKGLEGIPSIDTPIEDRYIWVVGNMNTLDKPDQQIITGIWNTLNEIYFKHTPAEGESYAEYLKDTQSLDKYLQKSFESDEQASVISRDINDIAFQEPIHSVLSKYRRIFSQEATGAPK